jgi:hypothetical protein
VTTTTYNFRTNEREKGCWPLTLKAYVEHGFAQCNTNVERDQMEIALKQIIKDSITKGDLWTRDWSNFPQPLK